jgi:hypothetical protein
MQQSQTDLQTTAAASTAPAATLQPPAQKQPYQQPELRCYGSVTQLTLGTGGIRLDGRTNTRKS